MAGSCPSEKPISTALLPLLQQVLGQFSEYRVQGGLILENGVTSKIHLKKCDMAKMIERFPSSSSD